MIEEQRGVGVLAAIEQVDAVGLDPRALARHRDDGLVAADRDTGGQAEGVEMRVGAERHHGGGDVEGLAAVFDQADMVEPRAVADRNDQGVMDLIGLAPSAPM